MKNIQVGTWVEISDEYCEVYKVTETDNTISVCNETQAFDVTLDEVKQIFADKFSKIEIDRYITTYENEKYEHNDWLITIHNLK